MTGFLARITGQAGEPQLRPRPRTRFDPGPAADRRPGDRLGSPGGAVPTAEGLGTADRAPAASSHTPSPNGSTSAGSALRAPDPRSAGRSSSSGTTAGAVDTRLPATGIQRDAGHTGRSGQVTIGPAGPPAQPPANRSAVGDQRRLVGDQPRPPVALDEPDRRTFADPNATPHRGESGRRTRRGPESPQDGSGRRTPSLDAPTTRPRETPASSPQRAAEPERHAPGSAQQTEQTEQTDRPTEVTGPTQNHAEVIDRPEVPAQSPSTTTGFAAASARVVSRFTALPVSEPGAEPVVPDDLLPADLLPAMVARGLVDADADIAWAGDQGPPAGIAGSSATVRVVGNRDARGRAQSRAARTVGRPTVAVTIDRIEITPPPAAGPPAPQSATALPRVDHAAYRAQRRAGP
jgi:hypothetical protein